MLLFGLGRATGDMAFKRNGDPNVHDLATLLSTVDIRILPSFLVKIPTNSIVTIKA